MVKIRLIGAQKDVENALEKMKTAGVVLVDVSRPYPCRKASDGVRVYAQIDASSIEKSVRSLKRLGVVTAQPSLDAGNAKTLSVCLDTDLQPKAQVRIGDIDDEKAR